MELFFLIVIVGVLAIRWFVLREKLQRLAEQVAQLTVRISRLEHARASEPVVPKEVLPTPAATPSRDGKAPPDLSPAAPPGMPEVKPLFPRSEIFTDVPPPDSPSLGEHIRKYLGDEEWEALLGGSLLNKIGALVLVIGIALFLGYSFTHINPAGRALTSLGASFCLLGGGIFLERRKAYRVFARGLIGAGWAALYVTAYAMYAVPAARLIENPYAGSLLVFLVATGMIGHSLRYRIQAITGLAYFAAFAALSVTPWSIFALRAIVPLAASLLFLAYGFNWSAMAVFGTVATYAACIWRGSSSAPLFAVESMLFVYWSLFEAFDLLRVRRRTTGWELELVFPLNAIGFLGLSYNAWSIRDPQHLWKGCAFAAGLYLISSIIRGLRRAPDSFTHNADLVSRLRAGSYEAPATLSSCLTGLAITGRLVGVWLSAGFAIEAEILYLTGVFLDLAFLRSLGSAGFAFSLGRLVTNDISSDQVFRFAGSKPIHAWTPAALFHATLFYVNRLLRKPNFIYSSLAAALVAGVLAQELPARFIGTGWLVFAVILFEIGLRRRLKEFRYQAYALAVGGVIIGIYFHVLATWAHPWIPLACALALVYVLMLRLRLVPTLPKTEKKWFDMGAGAAITSLAFLLVWNLAPEHYVGLFSCMLAIVLFEVGARGLPAPLTRFSYVAAALAPLIVIGEATTQFSKFAPSYVWLSYSGTAVCLYFFSERAGQRHVLIQMLASSGAVVFTLCTAWLVVPNTAVAPIWAGIALGLFALGLSRKRLYERWQGYLVMAVAVVDAWDTGFHATASVVVLACFFAQFLSPPEGSEVPIGWPGYVEKYRRVYWSLLGTLSLTALLREQFPGGLLTTAWGIEGLTLLITGFPFRERILRLEGLAILLVCILKLFLYDLRNLETIYRILSFVALGLILLGVSSIYTRFRESVRRYL